jgi:hypothetical protein
MPRVIVWVVAVIELLDPAKGNAVRLMINPQGQKALAVDISYSIAE